MDYIFVKGARKHNLKHIDVKVPKNMITVFTGVSGSGKSTLAFNTIYSEGSSRYMEAISSELSNVYKVQDFDYIEGLMPSIALKQVRNTNNNPRSTVATVTDLATFFRILFSDAGRKICTYCGGSNKNGDMFCHHCSKELPVLKGQSFSFNTTEGMCPDCHGLGKKMDFDTNQIILRPDLPIHQQPWGDDGKTIFKQLTYFFEALAECYGYEYETPYEKLTAQQKNVILYGTGNNSIKYRDKKKGSIFNYRFPGIIPHLRKAYQTNKIESRLKSIEKYMKNIVCPTCRGGRFNPVVESVKFANMSMTECFNTEISELWKVCNESFVTIQNSHEIYTNKYSLNTQAPVDFSFVGVTRFALSEIVQRLNFLNKLGLGYLTLNRSTSTLSSGELQHIRLANHLGSNLGGMIYVLDEPTAGLHERDQLIIVEALKRLRDQGNTVIVVEHSEVVIRNADYLIDFGPGGGNKGGSICFAGNLLEIDSNNSTLTLQYLNKQKLIEIPKQRRKPDKYLALENAFKNNIQNISVKIPLNVFLTVTGVSGSGKSTLINQVLVPALIEKVKKVPAEEEYNAEIYGYEQVDDIIVIDQSPIGRMARSNVATYTGVFDEIRKVYSSQDTARVNGLKADMFSFNVPGGRCEICEGNGVVYRNVYFIHEVYSKCPHCEGKRYKDSVLEVKYNGKDINEVLDMTIEDAYEHFNQNGKICKILSSLIDIGLGYITLGQTANTFSGGEAQRIKLAKYLNQQIKRNTLFIFDEPTTGLHFEDVRKLVEVMQSIVDKGNTVICIEHNMDVVKISDYIIDLGPEGGKDGGRILCEGTPEEVSKNMGSYTGQCLKEYLK